MGTLGDMKRRIARELRGNREARSQISEAIDSAIKHYERRRFFFNEGRSTATTIAGQLTYEMPSDIIEVDHLTLSTDSTQYKLDRVPYVYFTERDTSVNPITGQPSRFAIFDYGLFLWPIPDAEYTLTMSYLRQLETITDNESNAWTTVAERLIRTHAELDLALRIIGDLPYATALQAIEAQEYLALKRETNQIISSGRIRPYY